MVKISKDTSQVRRPVLPFVVDPVLAQVPSWLHVSKTHMPDFVAAGEFRSVFAHPARVSGVKVLCVAAVPCCS